MAVERSETRAPPGCPSNVQNAQSRSAESAADSGGASPRAARGVPRSPFENCTRGPRLSGAGLARLADDELLALLIASRARVEPAALATAVALGAGRPLRELACAPAEELVAEGLARAAALRVAAAFELGRRVERGAREPRPQLRSAESVHALLGPELRGLGHETFHALLLDGKHRLRRRVQVSAGTLTTSLVHPREFFRAAIRESAAAVIAVHNHPSGDPEPSHEDLTVTRRLAEAGRLLGVPLLDHVVVGDGRYASIRERIEW